MQGLKKQDDRAAGLGYIRGMKYFILTATAFAFSTCSAPSPSTPPSPQEVFFASLSALCGQAFEGQLVSTDAADADFAKQSMVMHVLECSETEIRIPFHVGDDHSRTWVITREEDGLRLKHDHRHEDGSEDAVTQYGGDTIDVGTPTRQNFPVDDFSIAMFEREGLAASVVNVWSVEFDEGLFAYELTRPNRHFRVEFDTSVPVAAPPAPWGVE